jgi:poly-gamma-glutamate capsule biosynthesis protein CapA/YwtB (metallophosphatase superfamily)
MAITLALAGDTMLGRKVAERLRADPDLPLFADEVIDIARTADLLVVNLECCVSERGHRWPDPSKPFFFRAPPAAVDRLADLGVDAVTLANNHALDYGREALLDTMAYLFKAGIRYVGAGRDRDEARRAAVLDVAGTRVGVIGIADHPVDFAASEDAAGIAYADLRYGVPGWLTDLIASVEAEVVVVCPHWGPNMTAEPVTHVRAAAPVLVEAGACVVAGHSAHVFHGVQRLPGGVVLYDLGDFIDDYAVDPDLRNDLGLLWLVELDTGGPTRIEAIPLALDFCFTRLAVDEEAEWIARRLTEACSPFGVAVTRRGERLLLDREAPVAGDHTH